MVTGVRRWAKCPKGTKRQLRRADRAGELRQAAKATAHDMAHTLATAGTGDSPHTRDGNRVSGDVLTTSAS